MLSFAGIQSSGDTPSIHTLLHYDTGEGHISVPQHIGIKYQEFGIMLLETDYSYIEVLERQYMKDTVHVDKFPHPARLAKWQRKAAQGMGYTD